MDAMGKKYYRAVLQVEILSEEPIPDGVSLEAVAYNITEGHWSGSVSMPERTDHSGPEMAKMLLAQGSDPEFFMLTREGEAIED